MGFFLGLLLRFTFAGRSCVPGVFPVISDRAAASSSRETSLSVVSSASVGGADRMREVVVWPLTVSHLSITMRGMRVPPAAVFWW